MKREIPIAIGIIVGFAVIFTSYFSGVKALDAPRAALNDWYQTAIGWMLFIGVVNLALVHGRRVSSKREGWFFSLWTLVCMSGFLFYGIFFASSSSDLFYTWMLNSVLTPMQATVFACLVFYIGSAAYRSFRARNLDATLLLIAGVLLMLCRTTLGNLIFGAKVAQATSRWIMGIPNTAGMRGIQLGAVLGGIATALRVWLGIDRGHLGGLDGSGR